MQTEIRSALEVIDPPGLSILPASQLFAQAVTILGGHDQLPLTNGRVNETIRDQDMKCAKLLVIRAVAMMGVLCAGCFGVEATDAPIVLDGRRQLFLDDYLIGSMTRVKRTVEQAQKFSGNPVLWPTERWEPATAIVYGSVLRDGEKFKIWYKSGLGVGYAESDDGIHWNKPRLDLTRIDGEPSNILFTKKNITEGPDAFPYHHELFGVHRDDRDPDPARRYKMGFLSWGDRQLGSIQSLHGEQ